MERMIRIVQVEREEYKDKDTDKPARWVNAMKPNKQIELIRPLPFRALIQEHLLISSLL